MTPIQDEISHAAPSTDRRLRRRRAVVGAFIGAFLLLVAAFVAFQVGRPGAGGGGQRLNPGDFDEARRAFLEALDAGRTEAAHARTSDDFRARVNAGAFAERAAVYQAFRQKPGTRGVEGGTSDMIWDDLGPKRVTFTNTFQDREGQRLRYVMTVVRFDGPAGSGQPPAVIADFVVEPIAPVAAETRPVE